MENNECYICLEYISADSNSDIYILECCKNKVHLACLKQWYTYNKSTATCFICNQSEPLCRDLVNIPNEIVDNSYVIIPLNDNINDNEYNNTILSNNLIHSCKKCKIFITFIIVLIICGIIFSQNLF